MSGTCSIPEARPDVGSTSGGKRGPTLLAVISRRYELIIIDEVGYLPFEQDAANLFFQLVSIPATNAPC